jgi:hypothetical protein
VVFILCIAFLPFTVPPTIMFMCTFFNSHYKRQLSLPYILIC